MRHGHLIGNILYAVTLSCIYILGLTGCNDSTNLSGANLSGALTITTSSLPNGTVNQPYSASVSGSGGKAPYTWSVTPALPANLSFDTTTGAITGTPVTAGTASHTFTLHDSSSPPQTVQQSLTLTINPAPAPLSITTTSLPNGSVGQAYNQSVQATGGTGALTWSIVAGTLPQNLSLNPTTGVISGTPTAAGTSSFTVRVADTGGQAATQALSILINPPSPPHITTTSLPGGTVGLAYSETLQATGGTGTLVWSLSAGSLPANLTLSPAGTISGTPTNTGTSNFTVKVTDALAQSATQALSIAISAALTITTPSPLPNATVGKAYNTTLQRSGGVSPFIWSVTPALPSGLSLDTSTGKISGTPAAGTAGTYSRTFTVQDSSTPTPQTASKVLSLTIAS
jgi:putative Ig domain-containing protein